MKHIKKHSNSPNNNLLNNDNNFLNNDNKSINDDNESMNDDNNNYEIKKKKQRIDEEIERRNITEIDILKYNLSIDDAIWFMEHLQILNSIEEYTEERYILKQKIFNRFKQVTSSSYNSLKNDCNVDLNPDNNIVDKIFNSKHSDHIKSLMFIKYNRASEKSSTEEYFKAVEWVDYVLRIPLEVKIDLKNLNINNTLNNFWEIANKHIYGLHHVKEKLLETLCSYLKSNGTIGRVLTLIGPPGVGKTSIVYALAKAMNLSFNQISMSDIFDPSILVGHSSTYIGSHPGIIVDILRKNNRLDNIILLDEIDKIRPNLIDGHNLSFVLLKMLDNVQNKNFNDAYMPEINIDLSKIIFIATANNENDIPITLSDRLHKIYISGYNVNDKIQISKNFIIPKLLDKLNIETNKIVFSDDVLKYLINKLNDTPGVRNLERAISELLDRILLLDNLDKTSIPLSYIKYQISFPINISKQHINDLVSVT